MGGRDNSDKITARDSKVRWKVRIGNFLRVCVLEFTVGGFSFGDLTYVQYKFYVPGWSSYIVSNLRRIYVTAS